MLKNSSTHYGAVARTLHWLTALLFLLAYVAVYYRQWFTEVETPQNMVALHTHLSIGISLGVIAFLRVYWRARNPQPLPEPGKPLMHKLIHIGHMMLYAIIILMPITGYLGTGVATQFFYLFEIPKFADTVAFRVVVEDWMGLTFQEFEAPMDFIHKQGGAYFVWFMILGHAGAAFYHHVKLKDRTLLKMLPPKNNH